MEKPKILEVYGDRFNSETRTILALLEISNKAYAFKLIDSFYGEHRSIDYLKLNVTGSIPLIVDNNKKVFGRGDCFVNYLTGTVNPIKHLMPAEDTKELGILMNWYNCIFKPAS